MKLLELYKSKKEEEATQASMVDGGKVDIFGTKQSATPQTKYKEEDEDIIEQLMELKDVNNLNESVNSNLYNVEYSLDCVTPSNKIGRCGKLTDGRYFIIDENQLILTSVSFIFNGSDDSNENDIPIMNVKLLNNTDIKIYDNSTIEYKEIADKVNLINKNMVRCPVCGEYTDKSTIDTLEMCSNCYKQG